LGVGDRLRENRNKRQGIKIIKIKIMKIIKTCLVRFSVVPFFMPGTSPSPSGDIKDSHTVGINVEGDVNLRDTVGSWSIA
jgi:hypothetical protein